MRVRRLADRSDRPHLDAADPSGRDAGGDLDGFVQVAGTSQVERLAFARSMEVLGAQLSYMLPPPERLDTLAGYLQWRYFGLIALVLSIWGVISSTGSGRGDEERGLVEQWLAAGGW